MTGDIATIKLPRFVSDVRLTSEFAGGGDGTPALGVLSPFGGLLGFGVRRPGRPPAGLTFLRLPLPIASKRETIPGGPATIDDDRHSPNHTESSDDEPTVREVLREEIRTREEVRTRTRDADERGKTDTDGPGRTDSPSLISPPPRLVTTTSVLAVDRLDPGSTGTGGAGGPRAADPEVTADAAGRTGLLEHRREVTSTSPGRKRPSPADGATTGGPFAGVDRLSRGAANDREATTQSPKAEPSRRSDRVRAVGGESDAIPGEGGAEQDGRQRSFSGRSSSIGGRPPGEDVPAQTPPASGTDVRGRPPGRANDPGRTASVERERDAAADIRRETPDASGSVDRATRTGRSRPGVARLDPTPMTVLDGSSSDGNRGSAGERVPHGEGDPTGPVDRRASAPGPETAIGQKHTAGHGAAEFASGGDGRMTVEDAPGEAVPFPESVSIEGEGPEGRFVESLYREVVRKLQIERRRRGR